MQLDARYHGFLVLLEQDGVETECRIQHNLKHQFLGQFPGSGRSVSKWGQGRSGFLACQTLFGNRGFTG